MERDYYRDDFERLVRQKADQYRIYPSDRVWKGIRQALHPRRWSLLGLAVLILSGLGYFGITEFIAPPAKIVQQAQPSSSEKGGSSKLSSTPFTTVSPAQKPLAYPIRSARPTTITKEVQPEEPIRISDNYSPYEEAHNVDVSVISGSDRAPVSSSVDPGFTKLPVSLGSISRSMMPVESSSPNVQNVKEDDQTRVNWLQEFAAYELTPPKTKRMHWQLSFAPTMNYRKLNGSKDANLQSNVKNIPIALSIEGDIDNLVNHKPALGFELGSNMLYALNKTFTLKGGLQFNYSRYAIQAYSSPAEIATIALNTVVGTSMDSITTYSMIRNFGGYAVREIENHYFQISAPLGLQARLLGNDKLNLNVGGSLQPTYLLNRNSYLITTDYKNYTREPSLIRRWNINTSAEAFVAYKTGGVQWQIGPQFRYQLLSSYSDQYPIREYLMEYGVKIGVTRSIR